MLTGTPLDLTPFGAVLGWLGIFYLLLAASGLWLVLRGKTTLLRKVLGALVVLLLFGYQPGREVWEQYRARERLKLAMEHFERRCKAAGETINRTVDGVEGVVWMKWREKGGGRRDQFAPGDPLGSDCALEGCIRQLLRPVNSNVHAAVWKPGTKGFKFVETTDPRDGIRYRYIARIKMLNNLTKEEFHRSVDNYGYGAGPDGSFIVLERQPIDTYFARYGLEWRDISTQEDREHWIAGSSIEVVDLQTKETVARRAGYLIDTGQGSTAGFRDPSGWAKSYGPRCPRTEESSWDFAKRVLQPASEER